MQAIFFFPFLAVFWASRCMRFCLSNIIFNLHSSKMHTMRSSLRFEIITVNTMLKTQDLYFSMFKLINFTRFYNTNKFIESALVPPNRRQEIILITSKFILIINRVRVNFHNHLSTDGCKVWQPSSQIWFFRVMRYGSFT